MKYQQMFFVGVMVVFGLVGCSAMLVPATDDPAKKIAYAYQLFDQQQRPIPAEQLIRESIDIFKQENNKIGLAEGYRAYGFFFRSASIEKWREYYEVNSFLEKTASYNNRYDKSIEYFENAASLFSASDKFDKVTNVYLNMGFTYEFAGKNDKACEAYKMALEANRRFKNDNPGVSLVLPKGFVGTVDDYINGFLKRLKCE